MVPALTSVSRFHCACQYNAAWCAVVPERRHSLCTANHWALTRHCTATQLRLFMCTATHLHQGG